MLELHCTSHIMARDQKRKKNLAVHLAVYKALLQCIYIPLYIYIAIFSADEKLKNLSSVASSGSDSDSKAPDIKDTPQTQNRLSYTSIAFIYQNQIGLNFTIESIVRNHTFVRVFLLLFFSKCNQTITPFNTNG